nr:retrovirus-related Pol polyprotein from transposon TNT 1-94 [Tanacetum cinerariifolium]
MANLSDSEDIQCASFDHDHYQEAACAHHEEHMMHDCVQLDHVVDSHDEYMSDSNIIICDQYVRDNEVPVVHSGASSVPTDAFTMIYDDMCEPQDQSVSYPSRNTVVKNPLTAELAIYKEHVELDTEGTPQFGPERPRVYSDLNSEERDRYNADIRATNILLQGLPKDIYTLINHYTDAKDIWDNVKMLLEGSELTKKDRESQLYDNFKNFRQHKEESINDYYVRFSKLINDMRNIKMTIPKLQLNSKFVNNVLPEWGRFVTTVKLNRGLRESNYDQLFAYLKQHEAHAKENKMGGNVAGYGEAQNRVGNVDQGQARPGQARTAQENGVALDAEQLLFLAADPITDEARPSYDLDIMSEYVKDIDVSVVHSNASSVPNDTFMMIYDDMCEPIAPSVSNSSQNAVVKNSLTAELATYREQVELYERRA